MRMLIALVPLLVLTPLSPALAQFGLWCENADEVLAQVDGGTLTVLHRAALYNCCPTRFEHQLSGSGDTLRVVEIEILELPCPCLCCYDLSTDIENMPPGDFVVDFAWDDYETAGWQHRIIHVTVPDAGQTDPPRVSELESSGCIHNEDLTGAPLEGSSTWGRVKGVYR
jgi:hypothetical protein